MARPRKEQELDIARRAIDETIRLLSERGDLDVPLTAVAHAIGLSSALRETAIRAMPAIAATPKP